MFSILVVARWVVFAVLVEELFHLFPSDFTVLSRPRHIPTGGEQHLK